MTQQNGSVGNLGKLADLSVPMAIRAAATLRIADHVAEGPRTAAELADIVKVNAGPLDRVLRHLANAGVFSEDAEGRYGLTPVSEALRDDHPSHLRKRLDVDGALGRAELALVELPGTVRAGTNAYTTRYGRSLWEDLSADPALSDSFNAMMAINLAGVAPSIVSAYDWGSLKHVVDVGGGNGALLRALLTAYPNLRGTLVELPEAAEAAVLAFEDAGLADRVDVRSGSFFDPLPSGADAYVLSDVLHDWDDEDAKAILGRCAEAAGSDGAVLVVGEYGPDGESPSTTMDLRMLVYLNGQERSVGEVASLAADRGLAVAGVHTEGEISVVALRLDDEEDK
ncbi:ArsR family transcriptional regulator [Actinomadura syzygii]|uniref:Methyltransferase n=1 Tax=Actinomadura syzygii TaxID=1427538 RepID=A0A5D0TWS0_9ACTN|nr:ArsR family transcriptional regulator [Actinomadura syzygii]TYC09785.1 methyltransferase [Actinomadura syzygii]